MVGGGQHLRTVSPASTQRQQRQGQQQRQQQWQRQQDEQGLCQVLPTYATAGSPPTLALSPASTCRRSLAVLHTHLSVS